MKNQFFRLLMLALTFHVGAASSETSLHIPVRLSGHVPQEAVSEATLVEPLDATSHVPLTFVLPLRNKEALEELVRRMYDPQDEERYGKYLTAEEFAERFAPTQEDYDQVIAYVESLGMSVTETHSNRILLSVSGPTESIETAFNLGLHHYQTAEGSAFHAPDNDPEIPASIASIIHGVVGLDNHALSHTYNVSQELAEEVLTSNAVSNAFPSGPKGGYSPSDLVTAYNLTGVPGDGSGQIIAIFTLGGYQASDINTYANRFGLPIPKLTHILVDGGSGIAIHDETTLDIELALALAPQSQIYVYEGPNSFQGILHTYNRIATDNLAKQVSSSWGLGENKASRQFLEAENAIFLQMAANGQTIYAASGDNGAYDNYPSRALVVDDPASQPYVVGVGGTKLTVRSGNGAYYSETVWNRGLGRGAGGGGVSGFWPVPSWQANVANIYSKTHRNVPDVSLNADPNTGYAIFYNGQWYVMGGTSCAAPLWASFTARINQELVSKQRPTLGFANPLLYALGLGSSYADNFHDTTAGNNLFYSASKGYDNATGWGSFNGANLFASLTRPPQPPSPPQLSSHVQQPTLPELSPRLGVTMKHTASFKKRKTGTYTIVVSNHGDGATSDTVRVVVNLPRSLTYKSLSGSGWAFDSTTLTCTHSDVLEAGSSYPPITLTVSVDHEQGPKLVYPTATVSGGGSDSDTTNDLTIIR